MSVPAHCKLMKPAAIRLESFLNNFDFNTFETSNVLHNANCKIEPDTTLIKNLLVQQLYLPVNWVKLINFSQNYEINNYIEIGPGRVLSSLTKKLISKTDKITNFNYLILLIIRREEMNTNNLAVVTGSSRGIGRSIAERLLSDNYIVIVINK